MADVLNRTTLEYRRSVNTPDFPVEAWVINPDLSPVAGVPAHYWKLSGDVVSEMTQPEKDAVDAAIAAAVLAGLRSSAESLIDSSEGYDVRAIAKIMVDEINSLRGWVTSFVGQVAAATNLANLQTRVANLGGLQDRTLQQARAAYKNAISNGEVDA